MHSRLGVILHFKTILILQLEAAVVRVSVAQKLLLCFVLHSPTHTSLATSQSVSVFCASSVRSLSVLSRGGQLNLITAIYGKRGEDGYWECFGLVVPGRRGEVANRRWAWGSRQRLCTETHA